MDDFKPKTVQQISQQYRNDLSEWIEESRARPKLIGFLANDDEAAVTYAKFTERSCKKIGIRFDLKRVKREDLEEAIIEANEDRKVDGIMVYYPVFGGGHDQYIQNCVSPFKDVEGLCHTFRFNMYHNIRFIDVQKKSIIPCTPLAILKILYHMNAYDHDLEYGNQLEGKTITVINRSEVVGRPLAALLANDGAKTYSVDLDGILQFHRAPGRMKHRVTGTDLRLEEVLPKSDVIISGVPKRGYRVPSKLIKQGAFVIDFSSEGNFEDDVVDRASVFVGKIGSMTIVMLQRNLMRLYDYRRDAAMRFRFH
ncbi:uncharacterized protein LOC141853079 [Brevipalpus obovatus]|uniref:uncharacterized protein LOC141853079 n=1 Tax=Brevipalpus obovatus TaxID=246614 RepID=UPI003D9E7D60